MFIPRLITAAGGYMPIMNKSDTKLHIKKGQILARGPLAVMEPDPEPNTEIEEKETNTPANIRIARTGYRDPFTLQAWKKLWTQNFP